MPELPEVESIRIGMEKVLKDKAFLKVKIKNKKIISGSGTKRQEDDTKEKEFIKNVIGKKIIKINRRAKNIIIIFEDESVIVIHLKMTGQLIFKTENKNEGAEKDEMTADGNNKHTHIIFDFEGGKLFYNDVRKFGYVLYYESLAAAVGGGHFQKIGLEPFDKNFTLEHFIENIKTKNKNIKQILLEQSVVVGCGNIYADEVCFASKVLPIRNTKTLNNDELKALYTNIQKILKIAIEMGGSSISDYKLSDGSAGGYAKMHKVYGKNNIPCSVCKNILKKTITAGRATVFCDVCQK